MSRFQKSLSSLHGAIAATVLDSEDTNNGTLSNIAVPGTSNEVATSSNNQPQKAGKKAKNNKRKLEEKETSNEKGSASNIAVSGIINALPSTSRNARPGASGETGSRINLDNENTGTLSIKKKKKKLPDICKICLKSEIELKKITILNTRCGHVLCFNCLVACGFWREDCPVCRQKMRPFIKIKLN